MKSTIKLMLRTTVAIVLASALAPFVPGQQESSGQAGERKRNDSVRSETDRERRARDIREREYNLRMAEKEAHRPVERPEPQLALTQLREDFMRIQVVNSDLTQTISQAGALDLKLVAKSASEIKKRAERLKFNLALPEPEQGTKRPKSEVGAELEPLKSSLSALSELINGFVSNPMFKSVNVVDAQLAAKARRNLEEIIELSNGIKKSSERLSKASAQKPR